MILFNDTASDFEWIYPFWENLVQKIKFVSLSWNLYLGLFEYAEFNGDVLFFDWEYLFWANSVHKIRIVSSSWNLNIIIDSTKILKREGSISHLAFMGNCSTISHTF